MKSIVLVDGEHYPPVVARAVDELIRTGEEPVLALMVGGTEKLGQTEADLGIPLEPAGDDTERALALAIDRTGARLVIDVSDEPVLGYVERCRLACVALYKGAHYKGADFEFRPPPASNRPKVPSVAVYGTGKRSGKTSLSGAAARVFSENSLNPMVIAMGRGGPSQPETLKGGVRLDPAALLDLSRAGRHAASDYIEDAVTSRVPTVGAWRAGGGFSGATAFGNFGAAIEAAENLHPGLLILEGSGSAVPPAEWDSGIFVVDARIDPSYLCGYFGLYRVLRADLVVLTMCEETVDGGNISALERCLLSCSLSQPTIVRTVFRPHPLGRISGKKVWIATTASDQAKQILEHHLREHYGAEVVGGSNALADRMRLRGDLRGAPDAEVLLVEIKAAAVDVATSYGLDHGMEVVYLDNRPQGVDGEIERLHSELRNTAELARRRFLQATAETSPVQDESF